MAKSTMVALVIWIKLKFIVVYLDFLILQFHNYLRYFQNKPDRKIEFISEAVSLHELL